MRLPVSDRSRCFRGGFSGMSTASSSLLCDQSRDVPGLQHRVFLSDHVTTPSTFAVLTGALCPSENRDRLACDAGQERTAVVLGFDTVTTALELTEIRQYTSVHKLWEFVDVKRHAL